jgi:type I restriction enzyme, S subunit
MTTPTLHASRKTKTTALGELPVEWGVSPLRKCARLERGKFAFRPRTESRFYGGKMPFVQTGDVSNARTWIRSYTQTLSEEGVVISKVFPKGTILMTIAANIGDCAMLDFDSACPDSLIGIRPRDGVDGLFLLYTLIHRKSHLHYLAPAGAQKNLNLDFLQKVDVPLPPLPEQQRIAAVLETWDRALDQQEQLLETKQQLKRGLMQQILSGKRRFRGYQQPWRTCDLGDVFDRVLRRVTPDVEHVLSITARVGFVTQQEKFSKVIAGKTLDRYILLRKGEFAYNKGNSKSYPQGCIYKLDSYDEAAVPQVYICFASRSRDVDVDFYRYYFEAGLLNAQLMGIINAGVRNDGLLNMDADNFFKLRIRVPPLDEQQKIARVFSAVDRELVLLEREVDELHNQKRGLMQKLLTGKVRVRA